MPIKIISLSREAIHFDKNKINFEFFDAIDNNTTKSRFKFDTLKFKERYGREPSNGEIGCALSHFESIHDYLLSNSEDNLMVFEDDAMPTTSFIKKHKEILSDQIKTPEIFIIGYGHVTPKDLFVHSLKWPKTKTKNKWNIEFGVSNNNGCGTLGYVLNKPAAKIFTEETEVYWQADDWALFKKKGIEIQYIKTPLVYEDQNKVSAVGTLKIQQDNIFKYPVDNMHGIASGLLKRFRFKSNY